MNESTLKQLDILLNTDEKLRTILQGALSVAANVYAKDVEVMRKAGQTRLAEQFQKQFDEAIAVFTVIAI